MAPKAGIHYLCGVKGKKHVIALLLTVASTVGMVGAQDGALNRLPVTVYKGDTIPVVNMGDVFIYSRSFPNKRREREWWRKVRDVRKTLPLAHEIRGIIIETYEFQQTLPDDKARERHMKRVEKELMKTYKPVMTKLTLRQGKLLIKLVDRECNQTGYALIKVFRGKFRAGFYQAFASMLGASLKSDYDPEGEDAETEEIIFLIENGII